ncbi:MAG TPA: sigma factor-like helix-turn-helix DNA-binding protein [Terriglobales bacterium]|nr:sigma factor-like helix-turn-helix DNA-binding protein [Terriglobales bacterium]
MITESVPRQGWSFAAHAELMLPVLYGGQEQDLWPYRPRTLALLKRYGRTAVELGRLPSILGREFFRSRVTSRAVRSFEDVVVFVTDMERTLEGLEAGSRKVLAMYVLEEYTLSEMAVRLGCAERTAERLVHESVDRLSQALLSKGLMKALPQPTSGGEACGID